MTASEPAPADFLVNRFSAFVSKELGLHFPAERRRDLLRGVRSYAEELSFADAESCMTALLSGRLTKVQLENLAAHLTVGETYFYREGKTFEVLEHHVLPELLQRRELTRRLRIWSAACCTGEEPYSIAVALLRALPGYDDWSIDLLASDVNPRFLSKAEEGVYSEWSFRNSPSWLREKYFTSAGSGKWRVIDQVRKLPSFSIINLAKDSYPSSLNHTTGFDLVFCRNVLIYFSAEQAQRVLLKLGRCLSEGGWLVLGMTETLNFPVPGLERVNFGGLVLYRKGAGAEPKARWQAAPPSLPSKLQSASTAPFAHLSTGATEEEGDLLPHPVKHQQEIGCPDETSIQELSRLAQEHANLGRLEEALAFCDRLVAAEKLEPAHHRLRAMVLGELGRPDEAKQALHNTLYLDPHDVQALFSLGSLARRMGKTNEAERHFSQALEQLRRLPRETVVAGDLQAARMIEIIEQLQRSGGRS